jgi:hypothetical protein
MPSKKIISILIICLGIVGAVWVLQENFGSLPQTNAQNSLTSNSSYEAGSASSTAINWQNILGNVQSTTTVVSGLDNTTDSSSDDTLTSQLAKDFFGRYMLAQGQENQSGVDTTDGLDTNTTDQIASDVLSSGSYTANQNVVYTVQNLNIQPKSDKATVSKYVSIMVQNSDQMALNDKKNGSEVDIINNAILNQDQTEITKLDPIITSYQTLLSNMIKTPVPEDAKTLHLEFVNSISNVLSDLQAIRQTFIDPVKSLNALSSYQQDYINMGLAIQKLQSYAQIKLNSFGK